MTGEHPCALTRGQLEDGPARRDTTRDAFDPAAGALLHALERLSLPFAAWFEVLPIAPDAGSDDAVAGRPWLSAAEQRALTRLRNAKRRAEFVAGQMAAKRAVARALERTGFADIEIIRQPNGAPASRQEPKLHVSISHSARLAVAMTSYRPIGIDLELETQRPRELARWFFSRNEMQQLATKTGSDWHDLVNLLWTRKEAVAKVGQWGSSLHFAQIDCRRPKLMLGATALRLRSIRSSGYALSVAYEECVGASYG